MREKISNFLYTSWLNYWKSKFICFNRKVKTIDNRQIFYFISNEDLIFLFVNEEFSLQKLLEIKELFSSNHKIIWVFENKDFNNANTLSKKEKELIRKYTQYCNFLFFDDGKFLFRIKLNGEVEKMKHKEFFERALESKE